MTLRIRSMTHSGDRSPNLNLLERLGAVFLAVLLTGVAFAFVGLVNVSIQAWALNLAIAAGLGLISGLAARLALRRYRWPLRMAAALATVVVGMIFVGWLTLGFAGIMPRASSHLGVDWGGLARVALGILAALLTLRAWRSPTARAEDLRRPGSATEGLPSPNAALPTPLIPSLQQRQESLGATGDGPTASGRRPAWLPRAKPISQGWASRLNYWRQHALPQRHSGIHLIGAVEHRCPYCLEIVKPGDPRGVVTCPVCHTQHHADCWAVTGMCQVPHHHA
ncbi:MAG: RING finger protein [Anaerolineales bacterium]|jgi:hypothetical protein